VFADQYMIARGYGSQSVPEKILELPRSLWAYFMAAVKRGFVGLSSSIVLGVIAHNVVNISRAIQKRAAT
jgi:hypothetical protein